jgi:ornithine cyclodeaminase/alanine dehydrogenase
VQARTQLWGVHEAVDVDGGFVYDVVPSSAQSFADEMSKKLGIDVLVADSPSTLEHCNIICTATTSPSPVFDGNNVREGTHVNGIGSHTPTTRELDTALMKRSKLVVDSREACLAEAGDIITPIKEGAITEEHIHATLGEIICKQKKGRENEGEVTVFKSVGLAVQDAQLQDWSMIEQPKHALAERSRSRPNHKASFCFGLCSFLVLLEVFLLLGG